MFFIKNIHWMLSSESDPRWNTSGVIQGVALGDALAMFDREIARLKGQYGDPPKDLRYSNCKE